jgi:hypothetical protein
LLLQNYIRAFIKPSAEMQDDHELTGNDLRGVSCGHFKILAMHSCMLVPEVTPLAACVNKMDSKVCI